MEKIRFIISALILSFCMLTNVKVSAIDIPSVENTPTNIFEENEKSIDEYILKIMKKSHIPGVSAIIVRDNETIYNKSFGYANKEKMELVTSQTQFELGSTSKAFTGLAILKLEKEGKINLDEPVSKYIPWFQMRYKDEYVDITLGQLLYHTSGIPFSTINCILADQNKNALESTVRAIMECPLEYYPGTKFEYASINYDILGLVIEQISNMSYSEYMKKEIFVPLDMTQTYVFSGESLTENMASGYKLCFLKPREYKSPVYNGNAPAGYIISNANDIAKWLKVQMNSDNENEEFRGIINKSHIPDRTVQPSEDYSSYAAGWSVYQNEKGTLAHTGSNPNFSSCFIINKNENISIAIMANLNSSYTQLMATQILNILNDTDSVQSTSDIYQTVDTISSTLIIVLLPIICVALYYIFYYMNELRHHTRRLKNSICRTVLTTIAMLVLMLVFIYCIYGIPELIFKGGSWDFVQVWAPQSFMYLVPVLILAIIVLFIYFWLINISYKAESKSYFAIILLSTISGLANALIIFVVNIAIGNTKVFQDELFLVFIVAMAIYVVGQRVVRISLLTITNDLVYEQRTKLISKVIKASFTKIDNIEDGKIQAGLNNDAETVSTFANMLITAMTNFVTLITCFIYLGILNIWGLVFSILVIGVMVGCYMIVGQHAQSVWQQTRDSQNMFFKYIDDLLKGFKELKLSILKSNEFEKDMYSVCQEYRTKRIQGDLAFANVFVVGELLFTVVIGSVAFIFPVLFKGLTNETLRTYIFIFLYMTGPVNILLNTIPSIINARISYKRIVELIGYLEEDALEDKEELKLNVDSPLLIELKDIQYRYPNVLDNSFYIGPINLSFRSGEITFITGGNGSGKTTIVKLITGLYELQDGAIYLNGNKLSSNQLREQCTAIFSDFYLFEKLYGIEKRNDLALIQKHLEKLGIADKVEIENGVCNTIKLSTGQKKRLALLLAFMEDRPIYVLDEWAADQDPQFRRYFYTVILPELKARNKCIIAITHDDNYFYVADQIVKLRVGKIEE